MIRCRLSIQQYNVVNVKHLVLGSVQPGGALGTELGAVERALSARAQRARQRRVEATTQHARWPSGLAVSGGALDASRVDE